MAPASLLPLAVAGLVVLLWGATPVVTKIAAAEIDPVLVGLARTAIGGLAAAPLVLALRMRPPREPRQLGLLGLSSLCGFIAFPILFSIGQRHTSAMHGGLILAALPLFTGLYAALIERRLPGRLWWIGCAVALAGESLLIGLRAGTGGGEATLFGDLLVLAAALTAALGYVAGARLGQAGYSSLRTTFVGIFAAALLAAPWLSAAGGGALPQASAAAWGAVVFLGIVTSILGYVGWYWALAAGGIARMGLVQFFQPVSGLVLAALLLGERMTPPLLAACILILAGVFVAQRR